MHPVSPTHLRDACLTLMREAYPGGDPNHCWFTWGGPESGVLGTTAELSAEEASTPIRDGGPTVAAIGGHIRFLLQYGNTMFRGQKPSMNWDDSWPVRGVNENQWVQLQKDIENEYATAIQLIENFEHWDNEMVITGAFGQIAHVAYHLGAMRQMMLEILEAEEDVEDDES
ncbi:hypothetical protein KQI52_07505 [bacterium]|nr:hypothetical protein [bacterium]